MGKAGPAGRPSRRMERRSGGNVKLKVDSISENSASFRPGRMGMLRDFKWSIRFLAYAA